MINGFTRKLLLIILEFRWTESTNDGSQCFFLSLNKNVRFSLGQTTSQVPLMPQTRPQSTPSANNQCFSLVRSMPWQSPQISRKKRCITKEKNQFAMSQIIVNHKIDEQNVMIKRTKQS